MPTNSSPPTQTPAYVIGCAVGKASIVIFNSQTAQSRTVPNQPKDLAAFAATLDPTCLAVCEATGGHEAALLQALVKAGCPAHRADARKVKAFIRSFGTLGKTDAIDAKALARYGQERHASLARWLPADPHRAQLQALVLTRRDLVAERVAYKNKLAAPGAGLVKPYLSKLLTCLDAQIAALTRDIDALIQKTPTLDQAAKTIRTIIGIGPTTAAALLALMPELGTLNRREAAALSGLAPHPNQSGQADAYRRTKGGRPEIKRVLFMAAMVAAKHDPKQRAFHDRLISSGKKKLVALTAVMRKMIVVCNAVLRHNTASATTNSQTAGCG